MINRCTCKKINILCHIRCHGGRRCENKDEINSKAMFCIPVLPYYGGMIGNYHFSNTCSVDK